MTRLLSLVMLIVLCSACAPGVEVWSGSPNVARLDLDRSLFVTSDGFELPITYSQSDNPSAILIGVHGMNDYRRTFEEVGPWFADHDMTFIAYDQRGFGEAPRSGRWPGGDIMRRDLQEIVSAARNEFPQTPIYVIGVSMGGAVTLSSFEEGRAPQVEGIVLVAPAVWGWQALNPLYKFTLWTGAHLMPWKTLSGSRLEIWPSDNIEMLRALGADPLIIKETRIETIYGLVTLMDEAYASPERVNVPTLLIYGDKDEIVPSRPVQNVRGRLPDVQFIGYEKGYHMLLRDLQRKVVWQDLYDWIKGDAISAPDHSHEVSKGP